MSSNDPINAAAITKLFAKTKSVTFHYIARIKKRTRVDEEFNIQSTLDDNDYIMLDLVVNLGDDFSCFTMAAKSISQNIGIRITNF